jgi:alpha-L-fucosidase 2
MPLGAYGKEIVNLNIDSLWRGGPFESKVRMSYGA